MKRHKGTKEEVEKENRGGNGETESGKMEMQVQKDKRGAFGDHVNLFSCLFRITQMWVSHG